MKKALLIIASIVTLSFGMLSLPTFAAVGDEACEKHGSTFPELCQGGTEEDIENKVGDVLVVVYGLVATLAVIFIIIGGFKYTTSQGEPGKLQSAKNTIMYAIIGLLVTIFAFAITQFAMNAFTGQG